jgi:hypothetical protein
VEIPLINRLVKKGDQEKEIQQLCRYSGLVMERFERHRGMRLHSVCRKLQHSTVRTEQSLSSLHEQEGIKAITSSDSLTVCQKKR